jgi:hypothetical protein
MAGGFALLAFVAALAVGTAGAPALGGLSWVMVTAGAAGVVYAGGAVLVATLVDLRTHAHRGLRPATVTSHPSGTPPYPRAPRGDTSRSSGR